MIVDKQILNALPFSRVELGIMHPNESNNFAFNMKRLYHEQLQKQHRNIASMLSQPSNQLPSSPFTSQLHPNSTPSTPTLPQLHHSPEPQSSPALPIIPSTNPLIPIQYGAGSIAQISGADSFELAATSVLLQAMGFDGININMGCPASSAQNGLHGALMMITPGVETQLERLRANPAVYVPVSIKCRIGVNKPANYHWFKEWLFAYISQTGISHYIVHSRIAKLNFNPRKNLNVPPLHPQYIHYLQNDIRQYIEGEKEKLYKVISDYYAKHGTDDQPSPSQPRCNSLDTTNELQQLAQPSSRPIKPFGITGSHKNACMYYIDEASGKKCYVPLAVCLEYNGGVVATSQVAELSWALNENGGHVLRPSFLFPTTDQADHNNDDDVGDKQINEGENDPSQMNTRCWENTQHYTRLHIPALSEHSPNNTEAALSPETDFAWMKKGNDSTFTTTPQSNTDPTQSPSLTLKQPLLPGIMVGRGDMNDIFFPLFYDAFQHALVLASNGKLDAIPSLISPHYHRSIDSLVTDDIDPYDHTKLALNDSNLLQSQPIHSHTGDENNVTNDNVSTFVDSNDPDIILFNTLKSHMHTDPIQHHSGLYIDVRTGQWVNDSKSISTHAESSQQSKNVAEMTEVEKIESISGFPSLDFTIPSNPSRMDILFHYLTEIDRLLFHPTHGRDLQFQYEVSIKQAPTHSIPHSSSPVDIFRKPPFHSTHPEGQSTTPPSSTLTPSSTSSVSTTPVSQTAPNPLPETQMSFLDQSTPPLTPSETLELYEKHRLTPFDQQSLTTCVYNPLNRQSGLSNQPYPYELSQSSCSFATTVKPLAGKQFKPKPIKTEDDEGESDKTKTTGHPDDIDADDNDDDDDGDGTEGSLKPHPFVEYISKVLVAQEISDILTILDTIFYTYQKDLFDRGELKGVKKLHKPQSFDTITELLKAIELCQEHPFLSKVSHKSALNQAIASGVSVEEMKQELGGTGYPKWITSMADYNVLSEYRPLINDLRTITTTQYACIQNAINSSAKPHIIEKLEKQSWDLIFHRVNTYLQSTPSESFESLVQHKRYSSSDAKSRLASNVSRLTKISESQVIASTWYGYLYGASDLFLRPLTTLFANTEANEQWRKIIHTACLLTRGATDEIFNESFYWTHDNRFDGNSDPKYANHTPSRMKTLVKHIEDSDPQKQWHVHQNYPYMGTSSERYPLDRVDFAKSNIHQLLDPSQNESQSQTRNRNQVKQKYPIDALQYDPYTMQLYPLAIMDQFQDSPNSRSASPQPHSTRQSSPTRSQSPARRNVPLNANRSNKLTEFGPNKLTIADHPRSARAAGIIELDHPITKAPPALVNEKYQQYLVSKGDQFYSSIDKYAQIYLKYNQQSFDTYINNADGFLNNFYEHQRFRDEDTVQYIRQRKAEIARLKEEQQSRGEFAEKRQQSEADIMVQRLASQKGGDYEHIDVSEEYVTTKFAVLDKDLRRVHFSFIQRFPFDLSHVSNTTLHQLFQYLGADMELYSTSPFQQIGWDEQKQRYRRADDVELEQFQSRFALESVSWLQSIHANASQNANSSQINYNQEESQSSQQSQHLLFSPQLTSPQQPPHLPSISALLQPDNQAADVLEAMPLFAELCERHQTLISSHHSFQYLSQARINAHNALAYLRGQLALMDSITIPDAIKSTLSPLDLAEYRRSTLHFTVSRDLLRQPVLDFHAKYKLFQDAKNVLSAINNVSTYQTTTHFNPPSVIKPKEAKKIIPPTLAKKDGE